MSDNTRAQAEFTLNGTVYVVDVEQAAPDAKVNVTISPKAEETVTYYLTEAWIGDERVATGQSANQQGGFAAHEEQVNAQPCALVATWAVPLPKSLARYGSAGASKEDRLAWASEWLNNNPDRLASRVTSPHGPSSGERLTLLGTKFRVVCSERSHTRKETIVTLAPLAAGRTTHMYLPWPDLGKVVRKEALPIF